MTQNIAFIGAGNLASSIISGLLSQAYPKDNIRASARTESSVKALASKHGIATSTNNGEIARDADIIVLAVKPQVMKIACEDIREFASSKALIVSVAAGITCASIRHWLGNSLAIVRSMPNTPTQVLEGAIGLYANEQTNTQQKQQAESILAAVGTCCWVEEESLLDTVTAVAGSGPAYFFLFIESMIDAAVAQGLDKETARTLSLQTAFGAAKLARESGLDIAELRRRVTSPKGTTEQAILSFERDNLRQTVTNAMQACRERAQELATEQAP
ncbi:MAG: pyrroline-5-carboxylate reductase [Lentisphaeria bacterium]